MLRKITAQATPKPYMLRPTSEVVSTRTGSLWVTSGYLRPMHTTSPIQFSNDAEAEEMRAKKRQQMEESIKQGKLPEVYPQDEFRADTVVHKAKQSHTEEGIDRASQTAPMREAVSDDFADENSGISDAQMKPEKLLHVHEAPSPIKARPGTSVRDESSFSEAVGDDLGGGAGSKNRFKMNSSEHNQKFSARGNLNGMQSSTQRDQAESTFASPESAMGSGSGSMSSNRPSGERITGSKLSDIDRSSDSKNAEWSSASRSTNESWIADDQKPFSTYADSKSQRNQSRNATSASNFPQQQKRSYSNEAIIGDSPIASQSDSAKSSKRWPSSGSLDMADFLGEKRMQDDDKGTQAKKNEARLGPGWQNRIKDSEGKDFGSAGASGAPARNMRDKPVNQRRSYSTSLFATTTEPLKLDEYLAVDAYLGWRVHRSQCASTCSLNL